MKVNKIERIPSISDKKSNKEETQESFKELLLTATGFYDDVEKWKEDVLINGGSDYEKD